jgi:hypothetical protein
MLPNNLLPSDLQEIAFIAGGFAACPALASDVDVWVPVLGDVSVLNAARTRILSHLRLHGFNFEEQDGRGSKREQFALDRSLSRDIFVSSTFEGYHLSLLIRRVATVSAQGSLPYHIIIVNGEVDDVLSSFDISTHQCALTVRGFVAGEDWTPLHEDPKVITLKYTTAERLLKIRNRYAHLRRVVA